LRRGQRKEQGLDFGGAHFARAPAQTEECARTPAPNGRRPARSLCCSANIGCAHAPDRAGATTAAPQGRPDTLHGGSVRDEYPAFIASATEHKGLADDPLSQVAQQQTTLRSGCAVDITLDVMGNRTGLRWIALLTLVSVGSLLITGLKYWYWERTLHAGPLTGHRVEMPHVGAVYTSTFDALYLPARELLRPAVRSLPVGGVAIDAVADFVAVAGENVLLVGAWLALRRRRGGARTCAQTCHLTG
jgi:hypothetical protein